MKKKTIGKKRLFISVLLTGLFVYLAAPLYINFDSNLFRGLYESMHQNDAARIDIYNKGAGQNSAVKILSDVSYESPNWCKNLSGSSSCAVLKEKIAPDWQDYHVKFQVVGSGDVLLDFKGPNKLDEKGRRYPIVVDYKDIKVNGKSISPKVRQLWHDKPYSYAFTAQDGDVVNVSMKIRQHHFKISFLKKYFHLSLNMFLSVLILSFLLAYQLVQYIAKFKILENNSRIDIVFVLVFVFLLFVPMSRISKEDRSVQENRVLAKYQPLFVQGVFNPQYTKQFEQWFNDRFRARNAAISLHKEIYFHLDKYYHFGNYGIYKNDWMWEKTKLYSVISEYELKQIVKGIGAYKTFCEENNIKCYIEIVPRRLEFAKNEQFRIVPDNEKDKAQILKQKVKEKLDFDVIFPLKEMQEANKQDLVYFKTDHHWTDVGAFVGYQELMKAIKKDFADLKILSEDDFNISYDNRVRAEHDRTYGQGYTCKLLNLTDEECPLNTPYKYYTHKRKKDLKIDVDPLANKDFYASFAPNKQKVMIIGNSFTENISYFLAPSFEYVYKRRNNNAKYNNLKLSRWKDEILELKPDIVVILIESEYAARLQDLKD